MDILRPALVALAGLDIQINALRVTSEENGLADALSRFHWRAVANLCPQWRLPFHTSHLQPLQLGFSPSFAI